MKKSAPKTRGRDPSQKLKAEFDRLMKRACGPGSDLFQPEMATFCNYMSERADSMALVIAWANPATKWSDDTITRRRTALPPRRKSWRSCPGWRASG
jgi:hypothetical protein